MAVDFSIHAPQRDTRDATSSASGAPAASGTFMGHAATVIANPLSLLADAAEELTFAVDTTDDFELSERKEEDKSLKSQEGRVRLYKDLMHQAGKSQNMAQLADQLLNAKTKSEVMRQARENFPDPSDAYAALEYALELLEKREASPGTLQAVKSAREALLEEEGPTIKAGIQAMLVAQGYGELDSGNVLRGLYRQTVCDFSTVNEVFDHLLDKYGTDHFDLAINFLTRTLSVDLTADMPSMGKAHLENVNANLGLVRLIQSVHAQCDRVMTRWRNVHDIQDCPLHSRALLGRILALREENFPGANHFENIVTAASPPDIEREVLFLQELMQMVRSLPSQLFGGHSGYMKILDAVQSAVDNAIEREDALYAAQEE